MIRALLVLLVGCGGSGGGGGPHNPPVMSPPPTPMGPWVGTVNIDFMVNAGALSDGPGHTHYTLTPSGATFEAAENGTATLDDGTVIRTDCSGAGKVFFDVTYFIDGRWVMTAEVPRIHCTGSIGTPYDFYARGFMQFFGHDGVLSGSDGKPALLEGSRKIDVPANDQTVTWHLTRS